MSVGDQPQKFWTYSIRESRDEAEMKGITSVRENSRIQDFSRNNESRADGKRKEIV